MITNLAQPRVSIVVTTYNQAMYVDEAVESALSQSYANREVIVVDDGSTDGTIVVLERFGERITLIRQQNAGVAGSRNRGVRAAKGDLIAFLDGDDRWHRDKLSQQVEAFRRFPQAGLIACNARHVDTVGQILEDSLFPMAVHRLCQGERCILASCVANLIHENLIYSTSQVMIPRKIFDEVGVSDTTFPVASDYDLYLRIAYRFPIVFIVDALADWRYVPSGVSGPMALRRLRWSEDILAVLRKHTRLAPPAWRALLRETLVIETREAARRAYYYGRDRDAKWARTYLSRLLFSSRRLVVAAYLTGVILPRALQWRVEKARN
jgi:glycosyltransferase involved in cell wall biosynthesis